MAGSKRIRLFAEFLSKKNQVTVVTLQSLNKEQINCKVGNIEHKRISISRLGSFTNRLKIKQVLKNLYVSNIPNILFLYDGIGLTNLLFAKIGRELGYKIVTDVVEDYNTHQEKTSFKLSALHKINARIEKKTAQLTDGVVVLSSRLHNKFMQLGVPSGKIINIPVSAENLTYTYTKNNNSQFSFVYSGSYGNKDGIDFLLKAFYKFQSQNKECELILAGNIPKHIALDIDQNKNIKKAGLIKDEDYYQFISNANVLMVTRPNSIYANSGFPFKLGEYLATGNPVITTKVSDIENYLKDREDIILAEASDVNSLCNAMKFAFENKQLLSRIGESGKQKCEKHFNPTHNGDLLENFLMMITNA